MRRQPSFARLAAGPLLAGAGAVTAALGGCGSRGPLDDATNVTLDAAPEAEPTVEASIVEEAAAPQATDAGRRDAGPVACGLCVISTCGDMILSCIQSEACRAVFQCVATTCLAGGGSGGGGGLDPVCLFQCAGQDPSGALGVLSVFQCITGECGADCGSVLGGLGGGLGGDKGPGGGGKGPGGDGAPESLRELFSPWPELFTPATGITPRGGAPSAR